MKDLIHLARKYAKLVQYSRGIQNEIKDLRDSLLSSAQPGWKQETAHGTVSLVPMNSLTVKDEDRFLSLAEERGILEQVSDRRVSVKKIRDLLAVLGRSEDETDYVLEQEILPEISLEGSVRVEVR